MHNKEKYNLVINKSAGILAELVANQYQLIIKGKISKEFWKAVQGNSNISI